MSRFGLLREHDFRQLFFADTISQVGSQVTMLALPLVAVLALNATPLEVGLLAACESAAFAVLTLPAGAWVDRMRRRSVLIAGDAGRALILASVPLAWWAGVLTMPQLYVVGLLTGVLTVFFDVAYQSYLPHLVGKEHLVEGNSKLEVVRNVTQIGGPTLAGFAVQLLTAPVAIVADAVSFVGSALFVGLIRKREAKPERGPDAHLGREIMEGLRFVFGNRLLRSIAACTGSSNLFSSISFSMVIIFFVRNLGLSPGAIGLIFSIGAIGGLAGAFTTGRVVRWLGQGPTIWISQVVAGLAGLLFPLAQRGWLLYLAVFGFMVTSVTVVVYNVTQVSFRQGLTPDRLLGRMNATMRFLVWGTLPLGGLIGGILGNSPLGIRGTLWVGAIGGMLTFLPVFLSPLRRMRELPTGVAEDQPAPAPSAA
jgi:MFS family permease